MQDRKYFGMTTQQLGILVGLGIFACLLFGVTGVLFFRRGLSGLLPQNPITLSTIEPTSTVVFTPTVSLTETPTPVPYDQLVPAGWTQHKTGLVELWLPADFKNAKPGLVSSVAGKSVISELALVFSSKTSTYPTTVSVSYEPLTSNTLEEFIDSKLANIPSDVNMAERRKVSINSVDAYRLMFEGRTNNVSTDDLLFVFQDGSVVWYVKYSAEITDFYEMLPSFEQSIKTFRMVR